MDTLDDHPLLSNVISSILGGGDTIQDKLKRGSYIVGGGGVGIWEEGNE